MRYTPYNKQHAHGAPIIGDEMCVVTWCPGGHRLVVENAAQEIHDEISRDGASGSHATSLEEVAEAEGSLRLRPIGWPHTAATDHPLAVGGISEVIQRCAWFRKTRA